MSMLLQGYIIMKETFGEIKYEIEMNSIRLIIEPKAVGNTQY